jgi:hypothetical protein
MVQSEDVLATEDVTTQRVAVRSIAWLGRFVMSQFGDTATMDNCETAACSVS